MTDDNKQKAKDKFQSLVKSRVDDLFSKPLSQTEMDLIVMNEVGSILKEVTVMNNTASDALVKSKDILDKLDVSEKGVADLERQLKLREELDIAA